MSFPETPFTPFALQSSKVSSSILWLMQRPPLHRRKNSKSPQRIKLACRGGLLNQQQRSPAIPRILRNVLTRHHAAASDLLGNELPISWPSLEMHRPTHRPGNPVTVQYLFCLFLQNFPRSAHSVPTLCVGVLSRSAVSCHFFTPVCVGPLSYPPPLAQKNSSDNKEPPVEPHDTTGVKDLQSLFSSSFHALTTPFSTSHKLLISALSSISVGDKSPVSCTWAPAPDGVSASTLKLFIIPPQGILLTPRLPI